MIGESDYLKLIRGVVIIDRIFSILGVLLDFILIFTDFIVNITSFLITLVPIVILAFIGFKFNVVVGIIVLIISISFFLQVWVDN